MMCTKSNDLEIRNLVCHANCQKARVNVNNVKNATILIKNKKGVSELHYPQHNGGKQMNRNDTNLLLSKIEKFISIEKQGISALFPVSFDTVLSKLNLDNLNLDQVDLLNLKHYINNIVDDCVAELNKQMDDFRIEFFNNILKSKADESFKNIHVKTYALKEYDDFTKKYQVDDIFELLSLHRLKRIMQQPYFLPVFDVVFAARIKTIMFPTLILIAISNPNSIKSAILENAKQHLEIKKNTLSTEFQISINSKYDELFGDLKDVVEKIVSKTTEIKENQDLISDNIGRENINALLKQKRIMIDSGLYEEYQELKDEIDRLIHNTKDEFKIAVCGNFGSGKTSIINALCGKEILPTAVIPATKVTTELRYGSTFKIIVHPRKGKWENSELPFEIDNSMDELRKYYDLLIERDTKKLGAVDSFEKISIFQPVDFLKKSICLIDTPGLWDNFWRATFEKDSSAKNSIVNSDALIYCMSAIAPYSQSDKENLDCILSHGINPIIVTTKCDFVNEKEKGKLIEYCSERYDSHTNLGKESFHFVSARDALEAKTNNDYDQLNKSGFTAFEKYLEQYIDNRYTSLEDTIAFNNLLSNRIYDLIISVADSLNAIEVLKRDMDKQNIRQFVDGLTQKQTQLKLWVEELEQIKCELIC